MSPKLSTIRALEFDIPGGSWLELNCTSRLDRSTCKLSCSCKRCAHIDLLNQMVLSAHTCAALPYRNLRERSNNFASCEWGKEWITIVSRGSFGFNQFAAPARCTRHRRYAVFAFDLCHIKLEWIFAAAQFAARPTLETSSKYTWNLHKQRTRFSKPMSHLLVLQLLSATNKVFHSFQQNTNYLLQFETIVFISIALSLWCEYWKTPNSRCCITALTIYIHARHL